MTPAPREDALAKLLAEVKERISNCGPCVHVYALHAKLDKALSAPPSQSESDDEKLVEAMSNAFWGYDHWDKNLLTNMRRALAVARKALTPSPTPYVRPAAEIRAEIERAKAAPSHIRTDAEKAGNRGYLSGLRFALTPPTTEKETPR